MKKNYQEAGEWVIGAILQDPSENFVRVRRLLSSSDFLSPAHGKIFATTEEIYDRGDIPLDLSVIYSFLKKDDLQIARYLQDEIPTDEGIEYWARLVVEGSRKRELRELTSHEDFDLTRVEAIFEDLRSLNKGDTVLYQPINQIPPLSEEPGSRIKMGLIDLDRTVPFKLSHLLLIAAKTGLGKTSLALGMAHYISQERPVGFILLEGVAGEARLRLENSFGFVPEKNFYVSDPPTLSTLEFKQICKAMKSEQGVEVIFLDYLQLMREREDFRSRHLEISHVVRRIKEIAKELDVGMVVISQLSRGIDHRGENSLPTLSDLKESGDLEYCADEILFIHQPRKGEVDYRGDKVKLLILAKNRWGPTGKMKVFWDAERTRFGNFQEGREGDDENG
jgi:replicative DNA helicase